MKKQESVYADVELFNAAAEQAKRKGTTKSKILTSWITEGRAGSRAEEIEDLQFMIRSYRSAVAEKNIIISELKAEIEKLKENKQ